VGPVTTDVVAVERGILKCHRISLSKLRTRTHRK
jgi:hypothetical protein